MVKDREAWHAAVHGVAKIVTRLSDLTTMIHTFVLYVCVSVSALQIRSSIPFFCCC